MISAVTVVGVNTNNAIALPPGEVHGRITDSAGAPASGASVFVKGNKKGTSTDVNGNFILKGVDNNATLIISNVGYESQEVRLAGRQELKLLLRASTSQLDETVVKGYYNTTERLNTGDITTVSSADFEKQPVTDPMLALDGRVPGLYIQQTSGVPGAYSTINIRGLNSIANGNSPFFVVDGVPYNSTSPTSIFVNGGALGYSTLGGGASPFNDVNPDDIESISVLKDADATAIYSSRGANGVILITTKRGKAGPTQVDVNAYSGVSEVAHFLNFMNTPEYLAMRHESIINDNFESFLTPQFAQYVPDILAWDTTRYTNWQKVLIGNAAKFNSVNTTLSGGNLNTQFRINMGYSNQGTVYPGNFADQKAMVSINLTNSSLNQRLHTQFTTS